jgi:methyl coenzyme M reductase beta subunit
MKYRKITAAVAAATTMGLLAPAAPASAAPGETSLAEVLDADGNKFDKNWDDFDIVHRAVTTVLGEKPDSDVALLADGSVTLTAFIPTDRAFRSLVTKVAGSKPKTEKATFNAIASTFDVDTIEAVLLYHVVPGAKINYKTALGADGASLDTAAGAPIKVKVKGKTVRLVDADTDSLNPKVIRKAANINKGNKQIAHGISRVLRPLDLP